MYKKFGGKNKVRWLVVLLVMIVAVLTLLIVLESLGATSIFTRLTSSPDAAITGAGGLVVTGLGIKFLLVKWKSTAPQILFTHSEHCRRRGGGSGTVENVFRSRNRR